MYMYGKMPYTTRSRRPSMARWRSVLFSLPIGQGSLSSHTKLLSIVSHLKMRNEVSMAVLYKPKRRRRTEICKMIKRVAELWCFLFWAFQHRAKKLQRRRHIPSATGIMTRTTQFARGVAPAPHSGLTKNPEKLMEKTVVMN